MGQYTFTWDHPAQEVYVTGDFDNWSKSVKLEKTGDSFRKTITLPGEESRIHYKETDASGNVNNVVEARELSPEPEDRPSHTFISSSAHPQSTTAALAGQETPGFEDLPGQFPITPMADLNQFTVNPIPATEGPSNPVKLPAGEPVPHPSTLTSNTIQSTVRDDPELKKAATSTDGANESRERELNENDLPGAYAPSTAEEEKEDTHAFGVNPIPATAGIGNPIKLPAGEPVPHPSKITSNTVQSTVRDGSQYGVSDTGAPVLPPVLDRQSEAEANGASMFNLPPIGGNMIPESSLPMGDDNTGRLPDFENAFTSSLAGQVPLEPRGARGVPGVVSESQEAAHVSPEAAANPEAVREKAAVENELKQTVSAENENDNAFVERSPVADAASSVSQAASNTASSVSQTASNATQAVSDSHVPEAVAGGLAAAGATAIGAALLAKDKLSEAYQHATEPTPASKEVPDVVTESQERARAEPEASASSEAVREKAAFEDELRHAVPEAPATSESGVLGTSEGGLAGKIAAGTAAVGTAAAGLAYAARDKATDAYENAGAPLSNLTKEPTIDGSVPEVVTESQERAHADPEASASPEVVREKTAMEGELLSEVSKAPATSESGAFGRSEQGIAEKATAGAAAASAAVSTQANKAYDSVGLPTRGTTELESGSEQVPEVVQESQERAHVEPEASANSEAVHEKHDMESELLSQVNKAPATSESGALGNSEQGITGKAAAGIAAGAAAIGATAAGAAYAARDKAADLTGRDLNTTEKSTSFESGSQQVPEVVHESQERAHVGPEASANAEAVHEKSDMEKELLSHVHKAPATSESGVLGNSEQGVTGRAAAGLTAGAAAIGATAVGAAYAARDKASDLTGRDLSTTERSTGLDSASEVPEVVHESQDRAHVEPEASANAEAVHEKSDMEKELLSHVHKAPATSESGALGNSEQGLTGKATAGIAAGTAALGATAAGAAYAARDKTVEATGRDPTSFLPPSVADAINNMNQGLPSTNTSLASPNLHSSVPEAVVDSQHQAHVAPEASAEPTAVSEKSEVERELLNRVPRTNEAGQPAPTETAALSAVAPVKPTEPSDMESAVLAAGGGSAATGITAVSGIPPVDAPPVSYSTTVPETHTSGLSEQPRDLTGGHSAMPTSVQSATTSAGAFTENNGLSGATTSAHPIYNEITSANARSTGLNAPADSQAQIPAPLETEKPAAATSAHPIYNEITSAKAKGTGLDAPAESETLAAPTLAAPTEQSRDVSPMTRPDSSKQTEPQVTTGAETHNVPATSGSTPTTPQRNATKRSSQFGSLRGTPKSDRTSIAGSSKVDEDGKPKKKGFLAKLKEKFRG
ncbi:unnamed protein product [Aureobasidium mustum]|uniref:AMP-activated protein kinase glycogen-binding domain-containing protein n=1 Tax=Aureobasidium mustum TaxID=2773714 RepID=A0A9N8PCU8_9PEZI|nr:unnamed protein product [Aureobasidium mustum]